MENLTEKELDLLQSILNYTAVADKNDNLTTGMLIRTNRESRYFDALFQKITNKSIEDYMSSFTDFKEFNT